MIINIRFLCVDIPPKESEEEISDHATVEQAIEEYARIRGIEIPLEQLKKSMFLVNRKPATLDDVLKDQDDLLVLRTLEGG